MTCLQLADTANRFVEALSEFPFGQCPPKELLERLLSSFFHISPWHTLIIRLESEFIYCDRTYPTPVNFAKSNREGETEKTSSHPSAVCCCDESQRVLDRVARAVVHASEAGQLAPKLRITA